MLVNADNPQSKDTDRIKKTDIELALTSKAHLNYTEKNRHIFQRGFYFMETVSCTREIAVEKDYDVVVLGGGPVLWQQRPLQKPVPVLPL